MILFFQGITSNRSSHLQHSYLPQCWLYDGCLSVTIATIMLTFQIDSVRHISKHFDFSLSVKLKYHRSYIELNAVLNRRFHIRIPPIDGILPLQKITVVYRRLYYWPGNISQFFTSGFQSSNPCITRTSVITSPNVRSGTNFRSFQRATPNSIENSSSLWGSLVSTTQRKVCSRPE